MVYCKPTFRYRSSLCRIPLIRKGAQFLQSPDKVAPLARPATGDHGQPMLSVRSNRENRVEDTVQVTAGQSQPSQLIGSDGHNQMCTQGLETIYQAFLDSRAGLE